MRNQLILVLVLFLSGAFIKVKAQCSVAVTPTTSTINCGQSVQLNTSATGGVITYNNDFNSGGAGVGWATTSGAVFTNPCAPHPSGSTYLWMGSGSAAPRTIQTNPMAINCAGTICFDLRLAVQGQASPCEGPDLNTEGVYLQYSTNGGVSWTTINYFDPTVPAGNPYTTWANYCFAIPGAAISPNTSFRWAQTATSSATNDHWGIDNVVISGTCANPHYFSWVPATGLSSSSSPNPTANPTTTTTYTVYYTDGISDSCSAVTTVNVVMPDVDAGATQSVCAGSTVTLNGSTTTSMNNPVTFTSSGTVAISDNTTSTLPINVSGVNLTSITTQDISQVCLNITHTFTGDLNLYLQCPGGTQLLLSGQNGGGGDNYTNTCFVPTATNVIGSAGNNTAPFTGSYAPEGAGGFNNLTGCSANGTWTLVVSDVAGGDIGTINNWSIVFNNPVTPTVFWTDSTGMTGASTYTPTVAPTSTTTYTISLTTTPGCTVTDTVSVIVNPLPTPNAGSDSTICFGDTTSLNAVGGLTYSWAPATGLSATNVPNPTAYPATTTDYTVTVSNGTCSGNDTVKVVVNQLPNVDAGTNTTICQGDTLNLSATGAAFYVWTPSTALSDDSIANPDATPMASVTYYVTGTDANACVKSDSIVVTVSPTPIANAGVDDTLCAGASTVLTGTGGTTFSWSPGSGLNNTASATPTASPTVTTTYVLTTTTGSCSDQDTVTVVVNPLPAVDAGPNQFICNGVSAQLNASGAVSYVWTPAATLSDDSIANPVATPTANTTYTVFGTDTNGCSKSDAVSIVILASPTVNANVVNDTICPGTSTSLTATSSASSFSWSPAAGLSSTTTANTTATPSVTTTYIVTVTQSGCTGQDSVTVTVNPLPVINAGPDVAHCAGDSSQLNASGGVTYSWTPTFNLTASNISNPIAFGNTTVSYTVTAVDANGCSNKDTVMVSVNALPVVNAGSNVSICPTDSAQLNATGAASYFWIPGAGLSDSTISNPVFIPGTTTTFTVVGTDTNGCSGAASIIVQVLTPPYVTVNSTQICAGGSDTLVATGAAAYSWSPAGTPAGPDAIAVSPATSTVYTVTGTGANGCIDTATAFVNVVTSIVSNPVVTDVSCNAACNGTADANISPAGFYNYTWSNAATTATVTNLCPGTYSFVATGSGGCIVADTITITEPAALAASVTTTPALCNGDSTGSASVSQTGGTATYNYTWSSAGSGQSSSNLPAGSYTVTVTDANNCQDTVQFTIAQPAVITATLTPSPISCVSTTGSVTTTVAGGTPNYTYSWAPSGSGQNPSGLGAGTYTLTVTDANNCVLTQTVAVTSSTNPPGANAGNDATLNCGSTASVPLSGGSGTSGANYSWSGPNGFSSSSQNPSVTDPGVYVLTVTNPSNGCTSTDTVVITQATINVSFNASPSSGPGPLTTAFTNTSTNATSFAWDFGNGTSSFQTHDTSMYVVPGSYTVTLIGMNANGCIDTATTIITVLEPFSIEVPNIFTPNGDGKNDEFLIKSTGLKTLNVDIFDRWGKKVYEITSPEGKWNGSDSSDGTYFFILKAVQYDDSEYSQQGYFQLIK